MASGIVGTERVKRGMAEMLKGGVIMDVVTPEQARIAEDAGAVAVMALERVPADIRAQGGVARMSDPDMIDGIIEAVSIPVMAKARIGHFAEAAHLARTSVDGSGDERALAESGLTAALRAVLTPEDVAVAQQTPEGPAMLAELAASCRRVQLSRTFLNDAVRACRQLRGQRMARLFRLAGHTPWPETWEMDDAMPEALARP